MTNEELAAAIKAGNTALYADLWEQVKKIILTRAKRFCVLCDGLCASHGVTAEDLEQCGYLALVDAVNAWTPDSGYRFTTFLNLHMKRQFRAALDGGKRRTAKDLLNCCDSLDKPTGEDEDGGTLGDLVPDQDALNDLEDAEDRVFHEQLREEVYSCLDTMNQDRAEVLRKRYLDGKTLREVAGDVGKSYQRVQSMERSGLLELHREPYLQRLRPFAEYLDTLAWRATGLASFRNTGASSVELAIEKVDEKLRQDRERLEQDKEWLRQRFPGIC